MANILIKQGREIAGSSLVTPSTKADKVDLTSIIETGTTSSQAISAGTYFYLNDVLVRAKVDIANGATFTLNTNYEVVTAGALNDIINNLIKVVRYTKTSDAMGAIACPALSGYRPVSLNVAGNTGWVERTFTSVDGGITAILTSYNGTPVTGTSHLIEVTYVKVVPTS